MERLLRQARQLLDEYNETGDKIGDNDKLLGHSGAASSNRSPAQIRTRAGAANSSLNQDQKLFETSRSNAIEASIQNIDFDKPQVSIYEYQSENEIDLLAKVLDSTTKMIDENIETNLRKRYLKQYQAQHQKFVESIESLNQTKPVSRVSTYSGTDSILASINKRDKNQTSNLDSTTHSPKKSLPGSFNKQNFIYAEALYEMNTLKINEEVPLHQIITKYCNDIHDAFIDSGDFSVSSLWKYMVDISILNSQTELNKMNDTNRQLLLVSLSIKHLERLFIAHIDSSIQMNYDDVSNIENKSMTTQSNDLNKLLLFIKTQENLNSRYNSGQNHFDEILDEDGKFGEISIWKIIFYCCRTGSLQSLMFVINNCRQQLGESYEFLKGFFIDHQNQEVFGQMREDLLITYKRKVFNSRNCYKKLIYCLMGKFDLDCDFSSILPTTEDYLWFALNQLNSPQKIEDLKSFQHIVRDSYGEEYFRADVQPFTYFIVLLMTLQYEFALEFLERSQHGKQLHHSVHFALAFNEMGIINIFSNRNSLNIIEASQANGAGSHSLNLSKLFLKYTSRFETSDQRLAFEYYYALDCCSLIDNQIANVSKMGSSRDSTALQQSATISTESLFIELVCSLVLKTRDYDFVFGVEDEDGKLKNGYISRFNCSNDFQTDMIHIAAKMSEKSGLINDALHFYKLSKRFNKLSVLLSRRFVSLFDKTDCFERKSLMEFTTNNLEALHKETIDISIRGTVSILFKCSKIYDLFNQNYFEEAFIAFQALHVLPFTLDQVQTALRQYLGQNKILQDAMPNIALLLSRIIQKLKLLYSKKLEDCHLVISDNSRRLEEKLRSLGQASDALQSFISQLPTSLSSYLCSEIVRNLQYIV